MTISKSNSATLTAEGTGGRFSLNVYFEEKSTSTADNTSSIYVEATLSKITGMFSVTNAGVLRIYWHDNNENYDRLVSSINVDEVGYNVQSRSTSGTISVSHKSDGTLDGYAYAEWERTNTYGYYAPASGGVDTGWTTLTTIPRASVPSIKTYPNNTPDFNLGDTITIHMNRKSTSFTHKVWIVYGGSEHLIAQNVAANCTFNTSTVENDITALIPTANVYNGTIKVTTYNGNTIIGTKTCTYKAHVVNANPIFSNYTYSDTNSTTSALTGNDQLLVQNKSTLTVAISSANKATAQKNATMSQYVATCANASATASYSSSAVNIALGTISSTGSQSITVGAKDSRGNITNVSKNVSVIPYSSPVLYVEGKRDNDFESNTKISIKNTSGISPIQVNGTRKNSISELSYRYKKATDSSYSVNFTNIPFTIDNNGKITVSDFYLSLDNNYQWDIQFKITDALETKYFTMNLDVGIPIFRIGTDGNVYAREKLVLTASDEIVTRFVFDDITTSTITTEVRYTKKGTPITFAKTQAGANVFIASGADNIKRARFIASIAGNTTSPIGASGLSSGSTLAGYFCGWENGNQGFHTNSATTSGSDNIGGTAYYFGTLLGVTGQKNTTTIVADIVRREGASGIWAYCGSIACAGSTTSVSFTAELSALTAGTIPSLFQSGASQKPHYTVWEIYEKA